MPFQVGNIAWTTIPCSDPYRESYPSKMVYHVFFRKYCLVDDTGCFKRALPYILSLFQVNVFYDKVLCIHKLIFLLWIMWLGVGLLCSVLESWCVVGGKEGGRREWSVFPDLWTLAAAVKGRCCLPTSSCCSCWYPYTHLLVLQHRTVVVLGDFQSMPGAGALLAHL